MEEFKWIKMSLFLILLLTFTAAAGYLLSSSVRAGDDVTLPCEHVTDGQRTCDSTTWLFSGSGTAVALFELGKIKEDARVKPDRLSVIEKCSLVIKKVTEEDAGRYTCRQFNTSGHQQGPDAKVDLSVVTMTEHQDSDEVTLRCSVSTYGPCSHTVKWLFKSHDVDKDNQDLRTSQSPCSSSVTFPTSHFSYTSRYQLFRCEVTEGDKVQEFPFSPQSSGGDTTTTTTTESTESLTTESSIQSGTSDAPPGQQGVLVYIIVALVLVALLITIVAVISWKKMKGNTTRESDNVGLTSNSAATHSAPETSQDTTDPKGGVSYASISYTNKTSRAQVRRKNDDEAVTYTTVKASSADPSDLYATIN